MVSTIQPTDFSIPDGKLPSDLLFLFATQTSYQARNSCLKSLESVIKGKGLMKIWPGKIDSTADLFESIIKHFDRNNPGYIISEWERGAMRTLAVAYMYAFEQYDAEDLSKNNLLRAVSFVVKHQDLIYPMSARKDGLKIILYYASKVDVTQIGSLKEYLTPPCAEVLSVFEGDYHEDGVAIFSEESWSSFGRLLKFLIDTKYFPEEIVSMLASIAEKLPEKKKLFPQDSFGSQLYQKAQHQVNYVLACAF